MERQVRIRTRKESKIRTLSFVGPRLFYSLALFIELRMWTWYAAGSAAISRSV